jgi:hypothetical protein
MAKKAYSTIFFRANLKFRNIKILMEKQGIWWYNGGIIKALNVNKAMDVRKGIE